MPNSCSPLVALVMGSKSDWETMRVCTDLLSCLQIPYHCQVISAHRTPDLLMDFAETAQAKGYQVIIAAAGGAAHLPGMFAAKTALPVIGVPIQSHALRGIDSLLSIAQMPGGIAVGTMAIGTAGAKNAALYAAAILALQFPQIAKSLKDYRQKQTQSVLDDLYFEEKK